MQVRDGYSGRDSSCGDGRTKSRFERYFGSSMGRILSSGWTVGPFITVVEPGRGCDLSGGWDAQALSLSELAVGHAGRKMGQVVEAPWNSRGCRCHL